MDEKERFDALMRLADFRFARWRERRTYEWKISMALWALLVAASAYLKTNGFTFPLSWTAFALGVIVVGHAWFWVRTNWISAEMDIRTAFHFAEHAEKILLPSSPVPKQRLDPDQFERSHGGFQFLHRGVCQAQVFTTAVLAVSLFLVLVFVPTRVTRPEPDAMIQLSATSPIVYISR